MAKFLTLFNVVAGGTSIAGLYLAIQPGYRSHGLWIIFGITVATSVYVLLVPGNPLERNVRSKIESYEAQADSGQIVIQRGDVTIDTNGEAAIEFYVPFADPPVVELIHKSGSRRVNPIVTAVTEHSATFRPFSTRWPADRAVFTWVARGIPLKKASRGLESE